MIRALLFSCFLLGSISEISQGSENSPLKLVFFDAPPFSWEKDGEVHGLAIELLNEVLTKHMNLKVEYEIHPWERAQKMVKDGIRDGFLNVPTMTRKGYTNVSKESLLTFDFIVFANPNNPHWLKLQKVRTIEGLKPFNNCHILGTHWGKKLKSKEMKTFLIKTTKQAFLMVHKNRCDTFVAPSLMGTWAIKSLGLQHTVSGIPEAVMDRFPYHLMLNKQSRFRHILPQFDRALKILKTEGVLKVIHKKYKLELLSTEWKQ